MILLALDISTKTGFAIFEDNLLKSYGVLQLKDRVVNFNNKEYPWTYEDATDTMGELLLDKVKKVNPDVVVVEETNSSRNRYSQKTLEFIHKAFLSKVKTFSPCPRVVYINSSAWRKCLNMRLSNEDKKNNKLVNQGLKKKLGLKGKITKKHLSVKLANDLYGLQLKIGQNDIADAICLGTSFLRNAPVCDGK